MSELNASRVYWVIRHPRRGSQPHRYETPLWYTRKQAWSYFVGLSIGGATVSILKKLGYRVVKVRIVEEADDE